MISPIGVGTQKKPNSASARQSLLPRLSISIMVLYTRAIIPDVVRSSGDSPSVRPANLRSTHWFSEHNPCVKSNPSSHARKGRLGLDFGDGTRTEAVG
jgi:hypothetical protein